MYCNYCGKVIQDDANVCAYCERRVGATIARKKLIRSRRDRKIAGVCAGFAEYVDMDVTLLRVLTVCLGIVWFPIVVAYVVMWIVVPEEPEIVVAPVSVQVPNQPST